MGIDPHGVDARSVLTVLHIHARRHLRRSSHMPRYLVQRSFPAGLEIPLDAHGESTVRAIVETNTDDSVTWLHSYVSTDRRTSFCVYDGPSPEAIRRTATRNRLPVDSITEVRVLDPYFYRCARAASHTPR